MKRQKPKRGLRAKYMKGHYRVCANKFYMRMRRSGTLKRKLDFINALMECAGIIIGIDPAVHGVERSIRCEQTLRITC